MVMAWDFWQQASTTHQLVHVHASAHVLGNPLESTPVVATLWQRRLWYFLASKAADSIRGGRSAEDRYRVPLGGRLGWL